MAPEEKKYEVEIDPRPTVEDFEFDIVQPGSLKSSPIPGTDYSDKSSGIRVILREGIGFTHAQKTETQFRPSIFISRPRSMSPVRVSLALIMVLVLVLRLVMYAEQV